MKIAYYKQYSNLEEFRSIITTDLNLYFIQSNNLVKDKLSLTSEKKSNLDIYGVQSKKIINYIVNESIDSIFCSVIKSKKSGIIELIEKIQDLYIEPRVSEDNISKIDQIDGKVLSPSLFKKTPYKFPDYYITKINDFLKFQNIVLDANFFEVGNLSTQKSFTSTSVFGGAGTSFIGSEKEKRKQKYIKELYYEVCEYLEWKDYSKQFSDISFVRLALSNKGTIFESDISVNLKFLKSSYVHFNDILVPKEHIIKFINDNNFIENFFGDISSVEISSYDYPVHTYSVPPNHGSLMPGFSYQPSYDSLVEDYFKQHESLQCYEEYEEGDYIIQKYHFKELKQHTNISFPVPLLFKKSVDNLEIGFEIISKENPQKKEGTITSAASKSNDT